MGRLAKIESFNPDEGITGKRARRAFITKIRGPDYEPLF